MHRMAKGRKEPMVSEESRSYRQEQGRHSHHMSYSPDHDHTLHLRIDRKSRHRSPHTPRLRIDHRKSRHRSPHTPRLRIDHRKSRYRSPHTPRLRIDHRMSRHHSQRNLRLRTSCHSNRLRHRIGRSRRCSPLLLRTRIRRCSPHLPLLHRTRIPRCNPLLPLRLRARSHRSPHLHIPKIGRTRNHRNSCPLQALRKPRRQSFCMKDDEINNRSLRLHVPPLRRTHSQRYSPNLLHHRDHSRGRRSSLPLHHHGSRTHSHHSSLLPPHPHLRRIRNRRNSLLSQIDRRHSSLLPLRIDQYRSHRRREPFRREPCRQEACKQPP